jgi:hypothetical protein
MGDRVMAFSARQKEWDGLGRKGKDTVIPP